MLSRFSPYTCCAEMARWRWCSWKRERSCCLEKKCKDFCSDQYLDLSRDISTQRIIKKRRKKKTPDCFLKPSCLQVDKLKKSFNYFNTHFTHHPPPHFILLCICMYVQQCVMETMTMSDLVKTKSCFIMRCMISFRCACTGLITISSPDVKERQVLKVLYLTG